VLLLLLLGAVRRHGSYRLFGVQDVLQDEALASCSTAGELRAPEPARVLLT
jgi:hypothetical protein